jgi:hypothetical protein
VWHTPGGDRVLTPGEWELVRAGLGLAWDAVEIAHEAGTGDATGVRVFDVLQPGQQVALLAQVGTALSDPAAPAPPLTAATEGALAAMFAQLRAWLEVELDAGETTECRRMILGAVGDAAGQDGPLPEPTETDAGEWELLLEEVEARLFWDADWEMGDVFLDLPPEAARTDLVLHGIDPDYFTSVPDDPDDDGLAAARRVLAELTGRPDERSAP